MLNSLTTRNLSPTARVGRGSPMARVGRGSPMTRVSRGSPTRSNPFSRRPKRETEKRLPKMRSLLEFCYRYHHSPSSSKLGCSKPSVSTSPVETSSQSTQLPLLRLRNLSVSKTLLSQSCDFFEFLLGSSKRESKKPITLKFLDELRCWRLTLSQSEYYSPMSSASFSMRPSPRRFDATNFPSGPTSQFEGMEFTPYSLAASHCQYLMSLT